MATKYASFNRFELQIPIKAIKDCSHSGACDNDVEFWANKIKRPTSLTPEILATELKEYGAWDKDDLADDNQNWHRIIWIACGNLAEDKS